MPAADKENDPKQEMSSAELKAATAAAKVLLEPWQKALFDQMCVPFVQSRIYICNGDRVTENTADNNRKPRRRPLRSSPCEPPACGGGRHPAGKECLIHAVGVKPLPRFRKSMYPSTIRTCLARTGLWTVFLVVDANLPNRCCGVVVVVTPPFQN